MVALEALACGIPVVASNIGGLRDVVQDGEDGFLVPPGDKEELVKRLEYFLSDLEVATQMGEKGAKRVVREMSWEAIGARYRKIYMDVL